MFTRRTFLGALAAGSAGATALGVLKPVLAQQVPDLDVIFSGDFVQDSEIFERLRLFSITLIDLRYLYRGPFGYEDLEWFNQASEAWRLAFGANLEEGFTAANVAFSEIFNTEVGSQITSAMTATLEEQLDGFAAWMSEIGIDPTGRLFRDLILGQAAMTILYSAKTPEVLATGNLDFFDSVTWVWPFCGG